MGQDKTQNPASKKKSCIHCGSPFRVDYRPDSDFCCNGCEYVYNLIKQEGLDYYYELRDRKIAPVRSSSLQERDYSWLESAAAERESHHPSQAELTLDLEGISCVGCVWLIERIFYRQPGAIRIEVNAQYGQTRIQWKPGHFPLIAFARELQQFGYLLGPLTENTRRESQRLTGKIGICGAFALNAMLFTLPRYLGMRSDFQFAQLFELLTFTFSTLALLTGGMYFIKRGLQGLSRGILHIDMPIALGIVLAYAGSIAGWIMGRSEFLYFDFVALFIFLMLVGRWVQERSLEKNRTFLLKQNARPLQARTVDKDFQKESTIPLDRIEEGQWLRVLPGEVVPVFSELQNRQASFSLEWINGESSMREMHEGQMVPAGSQNIGLEPILVEAGQTWSESILRKLLDRKESEERNPLLEKILRVYIVIIIFIALAGFSGWALWGNAPLTGLQVALSVLVVSCPCALGVAWPLAHEWSILSLRRHGVFARTATLFQRLKQIRSIIFDKTGTLTLEAPELENTDALKGIPESDRAVLRDMVKLSLHPVSRALREAFLRIPTETTNCKISVEESIGQGLIATAPDYTKWTLGRPGWKASDSSHTSTGAQCEFRKNGTLLASFSFRESLREDTREVMKILARKFSVWLLSGDKKDRVQRMAHLLELPPESARGEQSPEEKESWVSQQGHYSLFIGDGANDALAFRKAHVRGTPATPHGLLQEDADFFFTGKSLIGLSRLFDITYIRDNAIKQIFVFAVLYNISVVIIALSGHMHPLLAAILMPLSSLATIAIVAFHFRNNS